MSHFDTAESIATNTLLIPNIPDCFFGCDEAMLTIHDACAYYGPLYTFVPMKTFRRIMVIYQETEHAMKAKAELDKSTVVWKNGPKDITIKKGDTSETNSRILRFYYGQHFSMYTTQSTLDVPQFRRNMLISPPGSPCEGWEQIEEDSPNRRTLASDLIQAVADISDYELDEDELDLDSSTPSLTTPTSKKLNIVLEKDRDTPEHLPEITVEDYGDITDNKIHTRPVPTSMPPMRH
ncbi:carbohydrate-binding module 1 protein [Rhizopus azygosporus]|uniref:Carbohydrate-binding module 1 protein n=1 Tax=Rhizopus azygosporus TaxID=86630 RepID=A0A367JPB2_RHIAZ|nr:carbohydrate-binding module 1 protein [Rhizopus azygosporus]